MFAVPSTADQLVDVLGADVATLDGPYQTPGPLYGTAYAEDGPTALWGADFLVSEDRFGVEGIRPAWVDYDAATGQFAVLDRSWALLVLDGTSGSVTASLELAPGAERTIGVANTRETPYRGAVLGSLGGTGDVSIGQTTFTAIRSSARNAPALNASTPSIGRRSSSSDWVISPSDDHEVG